MFINRALLSSPDPFGFYEYGSQMPAGISGSAGRTQVSSIVVDRANTKIIIMDGQSEMATANGTSTYTTVNAASHNFNIYDGGIYTSVDPVLGASYDSTIGLSSMATRIADRLITGGKATRVIMVPIAVSNTPWAMYDPAAVGSLFTRFRAAYLRLAAHGLSPDVIITARGATDNVLNTSAASVKASIWAWADGVRALGCTAPIYLGKFTLVSGAVDTTVQAGIDSAIDVGRDIRAGYNADSNLTVAGGYRLADQTHLSNTGLTTGANGWADLVYP